VRSFFLFIVLSRVLGNPLIALVVVAAVAYAIDARWNGRWFDPRGLFRRRQAIHELRQTIERNEHDAAAHNDLGRILAQQGRYEAALPHLERAIRRMEEAPETNFYYGLCLLNTGRREEGERSIRRSLEINPRFLYGEPQTVLARTRLEHRDADGAQRWAREAVKLNTSSVEGWVLLGRAENDRGDATAARDAFAKAKDAYKHLPAYLHLPNRKWLVAAKRGERQARA
jgi:tetratricopeptide (TPR) repeat protein